MNKKHIYTAPEVEVVMLQMESSCLEHVSSVGSPTNTSVEDADYHDNVDW